MLLFCVFFIHLSVLVYIESVPHLFCTQQNCCCIVVTIYIVSAVKPPILRGLLSVLWPVRVVVFHIHAVFSDTKPVVLRQYAVAVGFTEFHAAVTK